MGYLGYTPKTMETSERKTDSILPFACTLSRTFAAVLAPPLRVWSTAAFLCPLHLRSLVQGYGASKEVEETTG